MNSQVVKLIPPNSFSPENHWYPKALNAQLHPLVGYFMYMSLEQIIARYVHLHPKVNEVALKEVLTYQPKHFKWAGADLMKTVTIKGNNRMVVIETNSCPSGQKSFPLVEEFSNKSGYQQLIENSFASLLKKRKAVPGGRVAVIYDKNEMETSGYAATLADYLKEAVYLVPLIDEDKSKVYRWKEGVLEIKEKKKWIPIRAAFRYVTQRPWNRIPLFTKTKIFNPIICCLAGGRNKLMASKAYDIYNGELQGSGLAIQTPKTIWDVRKQEIRLWVKHLGNRAVVKIPYSNAGQGVFPVTNQKELEELLVMDFPYDRCIVQSLIGNYSWSSLHNRSRLFQTGTIPTAQKESYVFDIRMMVQATKEGYRPLAIYSRRAARPMPKRLSKKIPSKEVLMTNLSLKNEKGEWDSDTSRLILMDRKDFSRLGISLDDLIEGYIQTVMAMIAIDKMAQRLISKKKTFKKKLFSSLNDDAQLIREILV